MAGKKHILIIDDDHHNGQVITDYLSQNGFTVDLAQNAGQAHSRIVNKCPDLVLLDLFLPDMKGTQFCSELRRQESTRHLPVILYTSHSISSKEKLDSFAAGVDDLLVRPFDLAELVARIQVLLRRAQLQPNKDLLNGINEFVKKKAAPVEQVPLPVSSASSPASTSVPASLESRDSNPIAAFSLKNLEQAAAPAATVEPLTLHELLERFWSLLRSPATVFAVLKERQDFLLSALMVGLTPVIASFSKLTARSGNFDEWIGSLSLGLMTHGIIWIGTAGLFHLCLPFSGVNLPMKRAFLIAGLGWAPRLLGGIMNALYPLIARVGFTPASMEFSAGIDLIPGIPQSDWILFIGRFGAFDLWCAWITLVGIWTLTGIKKRWNPITVLIGSVCFIFGALTNY